MGYNVLPIVAMFVAFLTGPIIVAIGLGVIRAYLAGGEDGGFGDPRD
jgi:hypothetical protein